MPSPSIAASIADIAQRTPEAPAILQPARPVLSYGELLRQILYVGRCLRGAGIEAEDSVGVTLPETAQHCIGVMSVACAAAAVPLVSRQTAHELRTRLEPLNLKALITPPDTLASSIATELNIPVLEATTDSGQMAGLFAFSESVHQGTFDNRGRSGIDVAVISSTSGTTSKPKQVPISHANVISRARCSIKQFQLTQDDRLLIPMPFNSSFTLFTGLMAVLQSGGSCVAMETFDPRLYLEYIETFSVTWALLGPSHLSALALQLEDEPSALRSHQLRFIRAGTGHLSDEVAERVERRLGAPVLTGYGLEELGAVACNPLPPRVRKRGTVGLPAEEMRILDSEGEDLESPNRGEVVVRGTQAITGYRHNEQANAESFLPGGWFRTGDEGFLDEDGYLTITGRIKELINRGGESISPYEVEDVLMAHPAVAEAVCFSIPHPSLGEDLVAAVVSRPGASVGESELIRYVAAHLSPGKVPSAVVFLSGFEKNTAGKVVRNQLALDLQDEIMRRPDRLDRPQSDTECLIAKRWATALGVGEPARQDNFFRLGGDSIRATSLALQLADELNCVLDPAVFFTHRTLEEAAAYVDQQLREQGHQPVAPIPVCPEETGPMSSQQRTLWFLNRLYPVNPAYNIGSSVKLGGALDVPRLLSALEAMVARHESLRTCFFLDNEGTKQRVLNPFVPDCPLEDLSMLDGESQSKVLHNRYQELVYESFDLSKVPLFRCRLAKLADESHAFVIVKHHIISDLWSHHIFVDDLLTAYENLKTGGAESNGKLEIRYLDYAHWQRRRMNDGSLTGQRAYWENRMKDAPPVTRFPPDRRQSDNPGFRSGRIDRRLTKDHADGLQARARELAATPYTLLLTALYILLFRYTGQSDLVVGSPFSNRPRGALTNLVGMFTSTLPVRVDVDGDPDLPELVGRVRKIVGEAQENSEFPFESIVEAVNPVREANRNPLFQVMLILAESPFGENYPSDLVVTPDTNLSAGPMFDIELYVSPCVSGLELRWEYDAELYDRATISRLQSQYEILLNSLIKNPVQRISEIDLSIPGEYERTVDNWNQTRRDYPLDKTLHGLFAERVLSNPDAPALIHGGETLTFAELDGRANQIGNQLIALGVLPGHRVGLCLDRSFDSVAALLAVLKCGAAFVPIDPSSPALRASTIAKASDMRVCITSTMQRALWEAVELDPFTILYVDCASDSLEPGIEQTVHMDIPSDSPAYVMFTSGSTGQPKGVMGSHRSVANGIHWLWEEFPFQPGEICCHRSRLTFIDTTWEVLAPVLGGTPMVIIPDEVALDPARLIDSLSTHRVTRIVSVPSLLDLFLSELDDVAARIPLLQTWLVGGEELSGSLARRFLELLPDRTLVNLYGATELAGNATYQVLPSREGPVDVEQRLIGRPIANTQVQVFGPDLRPAPIGMRGEIFVTGVCLAKGYTSGEAATFKLTTTEDGQTWFATGDFGRWCEAGLAYLGRIDRQVKVMGVRIELDEIETIVEGMEDIEECAAIVAGEGKGRRMRIFFATRDGVRVQSNVMASRLRQHLPPYMAAAEWHQLEKLPRTLSGKRDRQRLLEIDGTASLVGETEDSSLTGLEKALLDVWRQVLAVTRVGPDDNFFDLGGQSLLAVQLVSELERRLGVDLKLVEIYKRPTIRQLARHLSKSPGLSGESPAPLPIIPPSTGCKSLPLFCVYGVFIYRKLAVRLGTNQPTYGIYTQVEQDLLQRPSRELEEAFPTVQQLAADYVRQIRAVQPSGPYQLAGESFGGLVAYEMALQLTASGERIALLAILDAPTPQAFMHRRGREFLETGGNPSREADDLEGRYAGAATSSADSPGDGPQCVRRARLKAIANYEPGAYHGSVVLFRSEESRDKLPSFGDDTLGWRALVKERLTIHDLPGGHVGILDEPHVQNLAADLRQYLLGEGWVESDSAF